MAPSRATIRQKTLAHEVRFDGIGLHTGERIAVRLAPAPAGTGLVFASGDDRIPARTENVVSTVLATTLGLSNGARISTVEHFLAALAGMGVDNAIVEIDGSELPILDGSSQIFVDQILAAGIVEQRAERIVYCVRRPFGVRDGVKEATFWPAPGFRVSYSIDFAHPAIGEQRWDGLITPAIFARDLAAARTFGFLKDVEMLRASGLALGGSLENAVVLDDTGVLNPEGLRFPDEFVRHKVLDAIGDLALAGMPIVGHLVAHRAGHDLNQRLVREMLADPANYEIVTARDAADRGLELVESPRLARAG
ncbi:MAG TPA: UDP-3-O-acyl-N-acetylglucosamine deacetylase [bacterium]|nr:UDP-3-O-acyl-N-acetylglucosamine deacetylase [bacterium]